jgi:predicted AAA+ superfamily ATPase
MIIKRNLKAALERYASIFPVVVVVGPRQSGKTTLAKETFPDHLYFSLEEPRTFKNVSDDPGSFLERAYDVPGIIIDEFQNFPKLLSYMQGIVDNNRRTNGHFILTGSHNFLMNQAITQSLAGRVGILTLLPISLQELRASNLLSDNINSATFFGGYPDVVTRHLSIQDFYPNYNQTFIERDVRQLTQVGNLQDFQRFMQLCAARTGQLLNISALADDANISFATAKNWLSILEASYILFFLQPHFTNFNKRLVKASKLYFYDTGFACWLLNISSTEQLQEHYLRGGLVESLVISELRKTFYNYAQRPSIYFWRDSHGHEVDALLDYGTQLIPIEIKASKTILRSAYEGLHYWCEIAEVDPAIGYVIYAGTEEHSNRAGHLISWQNTGSIVRK